MRKIIVYIATSADGFIARLDGSVDWLERPRPKGNYGMGVSTNPSTRSSGAGRHAIWRSTFKRKACPARHSIPELRIMSSHAVRCHHQRQQAWSS